MAALWGTLKWGDNIIIIRPGVVSSACHGNYLFDSPCWSHRKRPTLLWETQPSWTLCDLIRSKCLSNVTPPNISCYQLFVCGIRNSYLDLREGSGGNRLHDQVSPNCLMKIITL